MVPLTTLTEYEAPDQLPAAVAFPTETADSLGAYLSRLGRRQLHVAETEKYAHVTYFFNGGVEEPFPGEDRILVPSNREVPTYDLAPEMSAGPITDRGRGRRSTPAPTTSSSPTTRTPTWSATPASGRPR